LKADEKKTDKVGLKDLHKILMFRMRLPESIKNDPEKVNRFISSFATENEEVHYRDFLDELRTFNYKGDCPDVASSITTYKFAEEMIPFEDPLIQNQFTVLNIQKIP